MKTKDILHLLFSLLFTFSAAAQVPFPTNIVVRQSSGSVTATWNAVPDTNVVTYILWYGTARGTYNVSAATTNLTLTVAGLPPGTYWFAVTARNRQGLDSDYSVEASTSIVKPATPTTAPTLSGVAPITIHLRSWGEDGTPLDRLVIGPFLVKTVQGAERFDVYADIGQTMGLIP